jgi:hypothetical protein
MSSSAFLDVSISNEWMVLRSLAPKCKIGCQASHVQSAFWAETNVQTGGYGEVKEGDDGAVR